jgi:nucleotide-binding universal stress UspA family protein
MRQTLLVPLDGSELGEAAVPWAACLARAGDFAIVLTQIVPWQPYYTMVADGTRQRLPTLAQEPVEVYLGQVRQRLLDQGLSAGTLARQGQPAETILQLADEVQAYAVVMATHGRGGLGRLLLGSVARKVLEQAVVPVLLVRARAAQAGREPALRRLLVPLDGSSLAERALKVARDVATEGATLVLTEVVAPIVRVPGSVGTGTPIVDKKATQRAVAAAESYLRALAAGDAPRLSIEPVVRTGAAGEEILRTAHEARADLIVMTTHAYTGPARWLLGSVADEVVRRAEQPVFLISARTKGTDRLAGTSVSTGRHTS